MRICRPGRAENFGGHVLARRRRQEVVRRMGPGRNSRATPAARTSPFSKRGPDLAQGQEAGSPENSPRDSLACPENRSPGQFTSGDGALWPPQSRRDPIFEPRRTCHSDSRPIRGPDRIALPTTLSENPGPPSLAGG